MWYSSCYSVVNVTQRNLTIISCPCGYVSFTSLLEPAPFEGLEMASVQPQLASFPFMHWNLSRFIESFSNIIDCER